MDDLKEILKAIAAILLADAIERIVDELFPRKDQ